MQKSWLIGMFLWRSATAIKYCIVTLPLLLYIISQKVLATLCQGLPLSFGMGLYQYTHMPLGQIMKKAKQNPYCSDSYQGGSMPTPRPTGNPGKKTRALLRFKGFVATKNSFDSTPQLCPNEDEWYEWLPVIPCPVLLPMFSGDFSFWWKRIIHNGIELIGFMSIQRESNIIMGCDVCCLLSTDETVGPL